MAKDYRNPEHVPPASQLAVLPLVAAIHGFLSGEADVPILRVTIHRTMSREGEGYLQQVCADFTKEGMDWRNKVGGIFAVDYGIIGAAYGNGHIWRTKACQTKDELLAKLPRRNPAETAMSWLAIPFLGPQDEVVLILFADCNVFNFFADDDRVRRVAAMCSGFCRLFDELQKDPFPNLRNFPLRKGQPFTREPTVYPAQESLDSIEPPKLEALSSFNYEATAA